jgi:O-antigen/teichoic acid export membrane protein
MSVKRNILAGWTAHLVTVLIGFFLMPYILGVLGDARYGAWLFVNAIAAYSGIIYAGFGATICRYVADTYTRRDWERMNHFVSAIQGVYYGSATLVLLAAGGFALLAPQLDKWGELPILEVQLSILTIGCTIAFGMVTSVYGGVLVGTQQLQIKRVIEVTCGVLRGIVTVLCLTREWGLLTLSLIFLGLTVLEQGLSAVAAYRIVPTLRVSPRLIRRDVLNECFGFSFFNAVALAAEYLIYFTDTIVIGVVLGPIAIVPYQIGLRIAQMIQLPIAQIGEAILPKAGELHANSHRAELGTLVAKAMGVAFLLAGGFCIGGAYFGDLLVQTWIGRSFNDTHTVLTILLAVQVVAMPMVIVRKALLGSGEVRIPAFIDLAEALANLVLSLILIRYWGMVGVAIGTLLPLAIIESCVLLPFAAKRLQLTWTSLKQQVLWPSIPPLLALVAYCEVTKPFTPAQGWIPLLLVTGGGGTVLLGVRGLIHWFNRSQPEATDIVLPSTSCTPQS